MPPRLAPDGGMLTALAIVRKVRKLTVGRRDAGVVLLDAAPHLRGRACRRHPPRLSALKLSKKNVDAGNKRGMTAERIVSTEFLPSRGAKPGTAFSIRIVS